MGRGERRAALRAKPFQVGGDGGFSPDLRSFAVISAVEMLGCKIMSCLSLFDLYVSSDSGSYWGSYVKFCLKEVLVCTLEPGCCMLMAVCTLELRCFLPLQGAAAGCRYPGTMPAYFLVYLTWTWPKHDQYVGLGWKWRRAPQIGPTLCRAPPRVARRCGCLSARPSMGLEGLLRVLKN